MTDETYISKPERYEKYLEDKDYKMRCLTSHIQHNGELEGLLEDTNTEGHLLS